jgi:hypothetical protein
MTKAPLGCEKTGPNPTDRGKLGTQRSVLVDEQGVPLALGVSGAQTPDGKLLEPTLEALVGERSDPHTTPSICVWIRPTAALRTNGCRLLLLSRAAIFFRWVFCGSRGLVLGAWLVACAPGRPFGILGLGRGMGLTQRFQRRLFLRFCLLRCRMLSHRRLVSGLLGCVKRDACAYRCGECQRVENRFNVCHLMTSVIKYPKTDDFRRGNIMPQVSFKKQRGLADGTV